MMKLIFSLVFVKLSATLALLRLIGPTSRWQKWYLYVNTALFLLLTVGALFASIVGPCEHPWPAGTYLCLAYDLNIGKGLVWTWSAHGAFIDITYSMVAMRLVYRLNIPRGKKSGLFLVLGLGWVASPFSILRSVSEKLYLFYGLETTLLIMSASLPTLMPIYRYLRHGTPLRPRAKDPEQDNRLLVFSQTRVGSKQAEQDIFDVEQGAENRAESSSNIIIG